MADKAQKFFAKSLDLLAEHGPMTERELVERLIALGHLDPSYLLRLDPDRAEKLIYPVDPD